MKNLSSAQNHPFFIKIIANEGLAISAPKSIDEVFYEYLRHLTLNTNHEYFVFAFKFLVLFRESINKYYSKEKDNNSENEYTEINDAQNVPDVCNYFVSTFMEDNFFFGMNSENEKIAFIEIIQHLCFWLYELNFTFSKLNLIGEYY